MHYAHHANIRRTPQSQPVLGRDQVENSAGGYVFAIDDKKRFDRFLILGCEGGTYYASERQLTIENAEVIVRLVKTDGVWAVARIIEISDSGRAPKNDAALFALAIAAGLGDDATRAAALQALPRVARTGTHLFTFLENVRGFHGWGRGLRRAVGRWYEQDVERVAYQLTKYRQRNGWTHRDVLRLAHTRALTGAHQALFHWVTQGKVLDDLPSFVHAFIEASQAKTVDEIVRVIDANQGLTWEMIPPQFLGEAKVWEALLPHLPMTALVRNLARMTANGLVAPLSNAARVVSERLGNAEALRKARMHPIAVLGALATYRSGRGVKGKLSWEPVAQVTDALDEAFYLAFGNVTPTGQRVLKALDVSGSMGTDDIANMPGVTPRMAAAALSLISARVEKQCAFTAFCDTLVPIDISPRMRLDDVIAKVDRHDFGGTDCAQPMLYALEHGLEVDLFEVYTDNETWAGDVHPHQALEQYRRKTGIAAKLVVVGMTATECSIADPNDAGQLDVVGFDTATPELISDFARG
ncbi:TROVE domain-containing protein [Candidatus Kaiserbacteria bacterium]|nr:TROVE domain-containing protein [Candidatus Kaiserbacteria bacterium]